MSPKQELANSQSLHMFSFWMMIVIIGVSAVIATYQPRTVYVFVGVVVTASLINLYHIVQASILFYLIQTYPEDKR